MPKTKTPKNKTIVNFVLDKSGSMSTVWDATISGFNEYIKTLDKDGNNYSFSLTLFDTVVKERYTNVPLEAVEELNKKTYIPSGMTALYDAVCRTIRSVEPKVTKKDKVLFIILTDGEENSSQEYTNNTLAAMIKEHQNKGNWTFVYLGANQDAWANAAVWGFNKNNVATFNSTTRGTSNAFSVMASNTASYAMMDSSSTDKFLSDEDKENLKKTQ